MDLRDIKEFIRDSIGYIILFASILILVLYVVSIGQISGPSMNPNFNHGDVIVLDKLKYKVMKIERFDVINFFQSDKYYTKRIIGLPGDKIVYQNNQLYINEVLVNEPFKKSGSMDDYQSSKTVPKNQYFVMGDNRANSEDSRNFGFIKSSQIIGKIEFKIWPLFRF